MVAVVDEASDAHVPTVVVDASAVAAPVAAPAVQPNPKPRRRRRRPLTLAYEQQRKRARAAVAAPAAAPRAPAAAAAAEPLATPPTARARTTSPPRAPRRAPAAAAPPAKKLRQTLASLPELVNQGRVAPGAGVLQVRWRGQDYEPTASVDAAGRITLDGSGETVASPSALLQRVMALNAATLCASGKANGWDGVCYDGRPLAEVRRA